MTPDYVAKKSIIPTLSFWLILFSWLILPFIIQISRIVSAKFYSIEFYQNKIVTKSGVFNKTETQTVFKGVYSVSVYRSFMGGIFGYGNIKVDCPGKWDIDTTGIKDPMALKQYLEGRITAAGMTNIIYN